MSPTHAEQMHGEFHIDDLSVSQAMLTDKGRPARRVHACYLVQECAHVIVGRNIGDIHLQEFLACIPILLDRGFIGGKEPEAFAIQDPHGQRMPRKYQLESRSNFPSTWSRFDALGRCLSRSAALGSRLASRPFGPPPKASLTSFDVPDLASHFGCCSSRKIRVFGAVTR